MSSVKTLVFIYNSFNDPLFQNLVLNYIKELTSNSKRKFYVITFEQEQYKLTPEEIYRTNQELREQNIYWFPLKFHTGRFLLFKKGYDVFQALLLIIRLKLFNGFNLIFAFANISASFSYIFSKLTNTQLLIYSFEPHSDFMVELGNWAKDSLKYKLLNWIEFKAGKEAEYVLTGTKHMVKLLHELKAKGEIFRAPTGINEKEIFPTEKSKALKAYLNLEGKKVLLYIGKFGDLYYKEEIPKLFKIYKEHISDLHFLVLTLSHMDEIREMFQLQGLSPDTYTILDGRMSREQINEYLGVGDIGLNAIPPTPAQKFRSPTKVGEYLLAGLPYITCEGISEDDDYATIYDVGVVLKDFSASEVQKSVNKVKVLLEKDKLKIQKNYIEVGKEYRSMDNVTILLKDIYNQLEK